MVVGGIPARDAFVYGRRPVPRGEPFRGAWTDAVGRGTARSFCCSVIPSPKHGVSTSVNGRAVVVVVLELVLIPYCGLCTGLGKERPWF